MTTDERSAAAIARIHGLLPRFDVFYLEAVAEQLERRLPPDSQAADSVFGLTIDDVRMLSLARALSESQRRGITDAMRELVETTARAIQSVHEIFDRRVRTTRRAGSSCRPAVHGPSERPRRTPRPA